MSELLKNLTNDDEMKGKYLTFLIDKEFYGIEISCVMEIIGIQRITQIPEIPDYIKGIINLRGKVIPIMDLGLRFKKQASEYDGRTCIIVISLDEISIGLIVEQVYEVLAISSEDIVDKPRVENEGQSLIKSIGRIDDQVILLIDCEKLLNNEN